LITAAGRNQRRFPLQYLVDATARKSRCSGILAEQSRAEKVEEIA